MTSMKMTDIANVRERAVKEDAENLKNSYMPAGPSRENEAGCLSSWTMTYMSYLLDAGCKHTLVHADLGPINNEDKCLTLQAPFDKYWELEQQKPLKKQNLWLVLGKTVGWLKVILALLFYLVYAAITFGPVLILNALVQHVQHTQVLHVGLLWFLVAMMFVLPMAGKWTLSLFACLAIQHVIDKVTFD